jgi:hypothetical protein
VRRQRLQLVGCVALLVAAKVCAAAQPMLSQRPLTWRAPRVQIEEIWAPEVRDFVYISDNAYTRDEILRFESTLIAALDFNLHEPTIVRFTERCATRAGAAPRE